LQVARRRRFRLASYAQVSGSNGGLDDGLQPWLLNVHVAVVEDLDHLLVDIDADHLQAVRGQADVTEAEDGEFMESK
jgi:hypothetical protein